MSSKRRKAQEEEELAGKSEEENEDLAEAEDDEEEIIFDSSEDENDDDEEEDSDEENENEDSDDDEEVDEETMNRYTKMVAGTQFPEDSSSEEEWDDPNRNTVGDIPMEYYNDYDHIGYNIRGQKILKPTGTSKDEIDKFLDTQDNPNYWRTVYDSVNQKEVVLSNEDYSLIKSLMKKKFPDNFDPYEPFVEIDNPDSIHPVKNLLPPKAAFIPSKWEAKKVRKLVYAIEKGWIKLKSDKEKKEGEQPSYYMMWGDDNKLLEDVRRRVLLPTPKPKLPGHIESFNPPAEYLMDEQERKEWEEEDPEDRPTNFIPTKVKSMREIPFYQNFVKERFERCLDLFLAPRVAPKNKPKKYEKIEDLLPKLPKPEELRPFPTIQNLLYTGHTGKVRSISVDPTGQWLVSGSDDETIRVWEVASGRCCKVIKTEGIVYTVAWNPDPQKKIVAAAVGTQVMMFNPATGSEEQTAAADEIIEKARATNNALEQFFQWQRIPEKEFEKGIRVRIQHPEVVRSLSWHSKGDYLIAVSPEAAQNALVIHQLSTHKSQTPFRKQKGRIQHAKFHPTKPLLFVATQLYIKIYNLAKLEMEKKLIPSVKWVSHFDIHPKGDNVILSSYDKKVCWFDMDLSSNPYKTMRYHKLAIRKVAYHPKYPLFASCSDDLAIHVFHGMVYNELDRNPLIVPVKILRGHERADSLGVLDLVFHPTQPWLFSCGSDSTIRLFT